MNVSGNLDADRNTLRALAMVLLCCRSSLCYSSKTHHIACLQQVEWCETHES